MERKSTKPAHPVGEVVRGIVGKLDERKAFGEEELLEVWASAVGQSGSRHSKPISLHKNVLTVIVDTPGWLQVLTLNKRKTLKVLKRYFGKDKLWDIRFRIGELHS